ncbi:MAG: phage baseplate assembly protein V [Pseudomonadales bacterium]|nr:phage baseplate assembly protein V [Pseudomonadales bacterium]
MSNSLFDTIRSIVQQEIKQLRLGELAVVQEQHPHESDSDQDNYSCTVALRDSEIVLKKVPVATGRLGIVSIPDVGDLVLVQFLNGDINAPVIVGSFYNDEDRPPASASGQAILQLPKDGSEGDGVHVKAVSEDETALTINIGGTVIVNLKDDDPAVEISVGDGSGTITIDSDGTVNIASSSALNVKSDADMNIEAGGTLNLKGSIVNIN